MQDYSIFYVEETDSTNLYARKIIQEKDIKNAFTVYTDFQTSGRGQRGNSWESEQGKNLLFSTVLFPDKVEASQQFVLSQIVSLAIKDILDEEVADISIKWPNDIYWKDKKITGILIENDIIDGYIYRSIIGVGINLNQETFCSNAPNPVSLKQITGKEYCKVNILEKIIDRLYFYYHLLRSDEGIASIRDKYKNSLFRKDGIHLFEDTNEKFYAEIADIEPSGLLVLKAEDREIRKYAFKKVKYIL